MSPHEALENGHAGERSHGKVIEGVYGPGSYTDPEFIPLPEDCRRILQYLAKNTPGFTKHDQALADVHFHGNDLPILPGPIKAQAFTAVIHAMIGIVSKEILLMRGIDPGKISIDIDQAGMYPASAFLVSFNGKTLPEMAADGSAFKIGTDLDHSKFSAGPLNFRGWSIYPTKDKNVYYQVMTNLDPLTWFQAYDIDPNTPVKTRDEAYEVIKAEMIKYSARELEQKNMEHGFCGQTCFSPQAWNETLMGKTFARHPIINYRRVKTTEDLPPVPFLKAPDDKRPLAGIRVVELARIIAAPALGATLTSLGAEVVKVESPLLPDPHVLQMSLTVGKYTCALDLTNESDRQRLHELVEGADVIVQAFRRRSLQRKGFGLEDLLEMAKKRNKGVVYVDLNCYGPDGTYAERPGYQQIADSASGCCYVLGKAYGFDEGVGVLPSLPIADMVTGAAGAVAVLLALRDRARLGGSYHADLALTAIDSVQLTPEIGLYPPEIAEKLQETYQFAKMTPDLHVEELLRVMIKAWKEKTDLLNRKEYYTQFAKSAFGTDHTLLGPVVKFDDQEATPHWRKPPEPYTYHNEVQWSH